MQLDRLRTFICRNAGGLAWLAFCLGILIRILPEIGRSVEEIGDIALISRQNAMAAHFAVLRGAYSRLGFFHTGPLAFYWMSAVDSLLPSKWFAPLSHYYQYALAVWMANTLIGWAAFRSASHLKLGSIQQIGIVGALVFFLWNLGPHVYFSPWGPHLTIIPMLWLLMNLARGAREQYWALPGLAFAAIWILHSHAGSLTFLGPALMLLLYYWLRLLRKGSLLGRNFNRPMALASIILVVGLAMPIAEAAIHNGGNLKAILDYLSENNTWRKPLKSLMFMLRAMDGPLSLPFPVFFPASLTLFLAWSKGRLSPERKTVFYFGLVIVAGSYYGALRTPGVLVPHLFDHLLPVQATLLVLAVGPAFENRRLLSPTASAWVASILSALLFSAGIARSARAPENAFLPSEMLKKLPVPSPGPETIRLQWTKEDLAVWPKAAGLALQMERRGYTVCIDRPYEVLFGPEILCQGKPDATILLEPAEKKPKNEDGQSILYKDIRATYTREPSDASQ
ncbi:MAG: hypothetical protein KDK37_01215 [Leptospiraceae bacterium]|nr:hypothetical protein [Leptospiraceae bacterium]MCB1302862.1 hypothetical protein [Leptospiraceae bacterium]